MRLCFHLIADERMGAGGDEDFAAFGLGFDAGGEIHCAADDGVVEEFGGAEAADGDEAGVRRCLALCARSAAL